MTPKYVRTRSIVTAAAVLLALTACDKLQHDLLTANVVGTVTPTSINNAGAADALRVGALGAFNAISGGGQVWTFSDLATDVWKTSDSRQQSGEFDIGLVFNSDVDLQASYANLYVAIARANEAIAALTTYMPTPTWGIAQMYLVKGYAEMELAEYFCNGTPLSVVKDGVIVYGAPLSNQQVYAVALAHVDSALAMLTASDATTLALQYAAKVTKARIQVDMGQFAAASTTAAVVPTAFAYANTFTLATGDNGVWNINNNTKRFTVGDSMDASGVIGNALPFASANDPRVRVAGTTLGTSSQGRGVDGSTNMVIQSIWGRSDAINIASGLDARLIDAEAALNRSDLAGMMTILNGLRQAPPALSPTYTPVAMAPLAVPASKDLATTLYFREKAFWTFGRGARLGDLRRLMRQYSRGHDAVFPTGIYFKTSAPYVSEVNLQLSILERTNPNVVLGANSSYCTDRLP
ncbi:MAG: hypothetical protein NTW72_03640 [Gemmatimonadetes bacterium]|nr:hypothetical protein [Gemmatimonadota bacterium]